MRGRRVLMESFVSHGVRHIFGNPGTTETPLLDSLAAFPQLEVFWLETSAGEDQVLLVTRDALVAGAGVR